MFELIIFILFGWLFFKAIRLALKLTWGAAKIIASIVFALALPVLIICLLFAGGLILLLPVAMAVIGFGILKACS